MLTETFKSANRQTAVHLLKNTNLVQIDNEVRFRFKHLIKHIKFLENFGIYLNGDIKKMITKNKLNLNSDLIFKNYKPILDYDFFYKINKLNKNTKKLIPSRMLWLYNIDLDRRNDIFFTAAGIEDALQVAYRFIG
jgi:hypothetical protein